MTTITAREQELLSLLIDHYIDDGQPIGSKTLSQTTSYSPATIRNVMAALEEKGYLSSPHTSAGRIPTHSGYRFFADTILQGRSSDANAEEVATQMQQLQTQLNRDLPPEQMMQQLSAALSNITQLAGLVTLPIQPQKVLQHIEFLRLGNRRLLTVIVYQGEQVQNRVFETTEDYSESMLQQASNYLNQHYAGKTLEDIQLQLLEDIEHSRLEAQAQMTALMREASQVLDQTVNSVGEAGDFLVSGETNLMNVSTVEQVDTLKQLFEVFREKTQLYQLLKTCMRSDDVQIFIGKESGHDVLEDYTVVAAPYKVNSEVVGVLGVIGPTRMPYNRAVRAVDITTKVFDNLLS